MEIQVRRKGPVLVVTDDGWSPGFSSVDGILGCKLPGCNEYPLLCSVEKLCKIFPSVKPLPALLLEPLEVKKLDHPVWSNSLLNSAVLMPHQVRAVDFILSRRNSFLAAEMGLGKTIITISAVLRANPGKVLVVCPASLKANWCSELNRFAPDLKVAVLDKPKQVQTNWPKTKENQIFIVSYSLLGSVENILIKEKWHWVVADEAHYVKSVKAKRSKIFSRIAKQALERVLLLSGTPAETHFDLYNLLKILDGRKFKFFHHYDTRRYNAAPSVSKFYYGERYCRPVLQHAVGGRQVYTFKQSCRLKELQHLVSPYMLTMRKNEVLDLPPLQRELVTVSECGSKLKTEFSSDLDKVETLRETKGSLFADSLLMELVRKTMRVKINDVCSYVRTILESYPEKFIVFFHHSELRVKLEELMVAQKQHYICVYGATPQAVRTDNFQRFQHDPGCRVALLSIQACGTGLNFQFVSLVLFAELLFNSALHSQSEARAHRMGQSKSVLCQYLVMKHSTDDLVWRSISRKANTQQGLLLNKEQGWVYSKRQKTQN